MAVHTDKTAWRAVDACGGTYTAEQDASGYARGHLTALTDALKAVQPVDALMSEMLDALQAANEALASITAFEDDARYIMGNTNFELVKLRREQVQAAIAKATGGQG